MDDELGTILLPVLEVTSVLDVDTGVLLETEDDQVELSVPDVVLNVIQVELVLVCVVASVLDVPRVMVEFQVQDVRVAVLVLSVVVTVVVRVSEIKYDVALEVVADPVNEVSVTVEVVLLHDTVDEVEETSLLVGTDEVGPVTELPHVDEVPVDDEEPGVVSVVSVLICTYEYRRT